MSWILKRLGLRDSDEKRMRKNRERLGVEKPGMEGWTSDQEGPTPGIPGPQVGGPPQMPGQQQNFLAGDPTSLGGPQEGVLGQSWDWVKENADILFKAGLITLSVYQSIRAGRQSSRDSDQSRRLAEESLGMYRDAVAGAEERYAMNSPLRDAFRQGALTHFDPTNPFAQDKFSHLLPNLQMESGVQAPAPAEPATPPGGGGDPGYKEPPDEGGTGGHPRPPAPRRGNPMVLEPDDESDPYAQGALGARLGGRVLGDPMMRSASVKSGPRGRMM